MKLTRWFRPAAGLPTIDTSDWEYDEMGIPMLRIDRQASSVVYPVIQWGTAARTSKGVAGTWSFYVDDYRFRALWVKPDTVVDTGAKVIVEPNFSVFEQTPRALALYQTYQKRWLARYWQEKGISVFVDLNVNHRWWRENLYGVPRGWKSYVTRGASDRIEELDAEYDMACEWAGSDVSFWVYGGGKKVGEHTAERGWSWIVEQQAVGAGRYLQLQLT